MHCSSCKSFVFAFRSFACLSLLVSVLIPGPAHSAALEHPLRVSVVSSNWGNAGQVPDGMAENIVDGDYGTAYAVHEGHAEATPNASLDSYMLAHVRFSRANVESVRLKLGFEVAATHAAFYGYYVLIGDGGIVQHLAWEQVTRPDDQNQSLVGEIDIVIPVPEALRTADEITVRPFAYGLTTGISQPENATVDIRLTIYEVQPTFAPDAPPLPVSRPRAIQRSTFDWGGANADLAENGWYCDAFDSDFTTAYGMMASQTSVIAGEQVSSDAALRAGMTMSVRRVRNYLTHVRAKMAVQVDAQTAAEVGFRLQLADGATLYPLDEQVITASPPAGGRLTHTFEVDLDVPPEAGWVDELILEVYGSGHERKNAWPPDPDTVTVRVDVYEIKESFAGGDDGLSPDPGMGGALCVSKRMWMPAMLIG